MQTFPSLRTLTLTLPILLSFNAYALGGTIDVFVSADNVTCEKACEDAADKAHAELRKKCDKSLRDVRIGAGFCSKYDYTDGCSLTAVATCI